MCFMKTQSGWYAERLHFPIAIIYLYILYILFIYLSISIYLSILFRFYKPRGARAQCKCTYIGSVSPNSSMPMSIRISRPLTCSYCLDLKLPSWFTGIILNKYHVEGCLKRDQVKDMSSLRHNYDRYHNQVSGMDLYI